MFFKTFLRWTAVLDAHPHYQYDWRTQGFGFVSGPKWLIMLGEAAVLRAVNAL